MKKQLSILFSLFLTHMLLGQSPYLVKDLMQGPSDPFVLESQILDSRSHLFYAREKRLYAIDKASHKVTELYNSDGHILFNSYPLWNDSLALVVSSDVRLPGKTLLYKLNTITKKISPLMSGNKQLFAEQTVLNSQLIENGILLAASDGVTGMELWKVGAEGIPILLKDFAPGPASTTLFFRGGKTRSFFSIGNQLWVTEGTIASTKVVDTLSNYIEDLHAGDKYAAFVSNDKLYYADDKSVTPVSTGAVRTNYISDNTDDFFRYTSSDTYLNGELDAATGAAYPYTYYKAGVPINLTYTSTFARYSMSRNPYEGDLFVRGPLTAGRYPMEYTTTVDVSLSSSSYPQDFLLEINDTLFYPKKIDQTTCAIEYITLGEQRTKGTALSFSSDAQSSNRTWYKVYKYDDEKAFVWLKYKEGDGLFYLPFRILVKGFSTLQFVRPSNLYTSYVWGTYNGVNGLYLLTMGQDKKSYSVTKLDAPIAPKGIGSMYTFVNSLDRLYFSGDTLPTMHTSDGTETGTQVLRVAKGFSGTVLPTCKGPLVFNSSGIYEIEGLDVEHKVSAGYPNLLGTYCDSIYFLNDNKLFWYKYQDTQLQKIDSIGYTYEYTFKKAGSHAVLVFLKGDKGSTKDLVIRHYINHVLVKETIAATPFSVNSKNANLQSTVYKGKVYLYLDFYNGLNDAFVWEYDPIAKAVVYKSFGLPHRSSLFLTHNGSTVYLHFSKDGGGCNSNGFLLYQSALDAPTIASVLKDSTMGTGAFLGSSYLYLSYTGGSTKLKRRESATVSVDDALAFDCPGTGEMYRFGNKLYFVAVHAQYGAELFEAGSQPNSVALTKDIKPGILSSMPSPFASSNRMAYFVADDGVHGREIWAMKNEEPLALEDISIAQVGMKVQLQPTPTMA